MSSSTSVPLYARPAHQVAFLRDLNDRQVRELCSHLLDMHDPYERVDPAAMREAEEFAKLGPFERNKRLVAQLLERTRANIARKNELTSSGSSGTEKLELTKIINTDLTEIKKLIDEADQHCKTDQRRLSKMEKKRGAESFELKEEQRLYSMRVAQLDIMKQHYDEVDALRNPAARARGRAGESRFATLEALDNPRNTGLPAIDLSEFNVQVDANRDQITKNVRKIGDAARGLKGIAQSLGSTLDEQNEKLEKLEKKVDVANEELYNVNKKLKETLEKIRGPSKFCADICCIVLLLAIGGYIFNMVR